MAYAQHERQVVNHRPFAAVYADAAARLAVVGFNGRAVFGSEDLHKVVLQADDLSMWMLTSTTAPYWSPFPYTGAAITEIFLTAAGGWPSSTNGCAANEKNEYATNNMDVWSLDFDAAAIEYAQWSVWMPDDWNGGTITFKALWTAASGSGDVRWGLQGRSYGDNEAIDATWGTGVIVTDTLLNANRTHVSAVSTAVTLAGTPAGGEMVQIRVYRDATNAGDTLNADAKLLGIKLYYTLS